MVPKCVRSRSVPSLDSAAFVKGFNAPPYVTEFGSSDREWLYLIDSRCPAENR